ncbi:hypothetical protein [Arthrobacter sp. GMC3]|uniref:hypothetical protein n=1 Tax=Arthrobacter sp. GMC3 TaxID=2058894 RepID=UPI0011B0C49F|nr:hypothetical protein [Arthrobacter sp. GMC3]
MPSSRLRVHAVIVLWLFGLQFLAGMILNLFVELPTTHPGAGGEYFSSSWKSLLWSMSDGGGWALLIHAWLAVLLFAGTLGLFLRSLPAGGRHWRWPSSIAALFTLGALFNGLSFADYGEDFSSMIMALCWLVAVALLVFALVRTGRKPEPSAKPAGPPTRQSQ